MASITRSPSSKELESLHSQKVTFTRWVNHCLSPYNVSVEDLYTGFADGTKLIHLLQVVSKKKISGKWHAAPKISSQKVENLEMCLKFIALEKIKLMNTGAMDIMNGNPKSILSVIWNLILTYQIAHGTTDTLKAKEELLQWAHVQLPPNSKWTGTPKDWSDGVAICALVESLQPGLCPDYSSMNPSEASQNALTGISLAEKELHVPALVTPEEMASDHLDQLSLLTYLAVLKQKDETHPITKLSLQKFPTTKILNNLQEFKDFCVGMGLDQLPESHTWQSEFDQFALNGKVLVPAALKLLRKCLKISFPETPEPQNQPLPFATPEKLLRTSSSANVTPVSTPTPLVTPGATPVATPIATPLMSPRKIDNGVSEQVAALTTQMSVCEAAKSSLTVKLAQVEKEKEEQKKLVLTLEEASKASSEKLAAQERVLEENNKKMTEISQEKADLEAQVAENEEKLREMAETIVQNSHDLSQKIQELKSSLESEKEQHQTEFSQYQSESSKKIEELQQESAQLQLKCQELTQQNQNHVTSLSENTEKTHQLESQYQNLLSKYQQLEFDSKNLSVETSKQIQDLQDQIATVSHEYELEKSHHLNLSSHFKVLQQENETLQPIQDELKKSQTDSEKLKTDLKWSSDMLAKMTAKLEALELDVKARESVNNKDHEHLVKEIEQWKVDVKTKEDEVHVLSEKLKHEREISAKFPVQLQKMELESENLKAELVRQKSSHEEGIVHYEHQIQTLKKAVELYEKEKTLATDSMLQVIGDLKEKLEQEKAKAEIFEKIQSVSEQETAELHKNVKKFGEEIVVLEGKNAVLKEENKALAQEIERKTQEIAELAANWEFQRKENEKVLEKREKEKKELKSLVEKNVEQVKEEKSKVENLIQQLKAQEEAFREQVEDLRMKSGEKAAEIESLNRESAKLTEELQKLSKSSDSKSEIDLQTIKDLESQLKSLQDQLKSEKSNTETLQQTSKSQTAESNSKIQALSLQVEQKQAEITTLTSQLSQIQQEKQTLEAQIHEIQSRDVSERESTQKTMETLKSQLESIQKELEISKRREEDSKRELETLNLEHHKCPEMITTLQVELERLKELQSQLLDLDSKEQEAVQMVANLKSGNEIPVQELMEMEKDMGNLQSKQEVITEAPSLVEHRPEFPVNPAKDKKWLWIVVASAGMFVTAALWPKTAKIIYVQQP